MGARYWLVGLLAAACFAISCGGDNSAGGNGDGGTDNGDGGTVVDAPPFGGECTPNGPYQCSDCVDNDEDGKIDGFDPECTGPHDNREDSFATGIPGDNMDPTDQECFFDGDSGMGNDGCNQHTCCLLRAKGVPTGDQTQLQADREECKRLAPAANANKYNPAECYEPFGNVTVPDQCAMNCGALTPPGCDCFGCCTVCTDAGCRDIVINQAVSPNCNQDNVTDPGPDGVDNTGDEPCRRCVKSTCGNEQCGGDTCILCPGQDPSDLPAECNGNACPDGIMPCAADGSCPQLQYCSNGCCISTIF